MAADEANVRMTADDAEAMAMWKRQFDAVERLAKKMDQFAQDGLGAGKGMQSSFENALLSVMSLEKGLGLISDGFQQILDRAQQFRDLQRDAALTRADTFNTFRLQAKIHDPKEIERAKGQLNQIGADMGVADLRVVDRIATQLVSSDFPKEEVLDKGGARSLVESFAASGLLGEGFDPQELTRALALYMTSTGQPLTAANLRKNAISVQQLRATGNLEFENLQGLSNEAGAITQLGKIDSQDQLILYDKLLKEMGPRIADTGMRVMITRLATAGGDKTRTKALADLGLTPEDVDFVGEDWQEVFAKLEKGRKGLPDLKDLGVTAKEDMDPDEWAATVKKMEESRRGLPEEEANIAFSKLFGAEGMRPALAIIKPGTADYVAGKRKEIEGEKDFQRDVRVATLENEASRLRGAQAREQAALDVPGALKQERIGTELAAILAERVAKEEISGGQAELTKERYRILAASGLAPERAAGVASSSAAFSYANFADRGIAEQARLAVKRGGGDESILGKLPENPEPGMTIQELNKQILAAEEMGFADRWSASRRKPIEEAAERAREELQRRGLGGGNAPAAPPLNQGAAMDNREMLDELKAIRMELSGRGPQRLMLEVPGRQVPARRAIDGFIG